MPASMPLVLVVAWALLFGFVNTHQRNASRFQGSSQHFLAVLRASVFLGMFSGLGLLIFYFTKVTWYWPLVLFIVGNLVGAFSFGVLEPILGKLIGVLTGNITNARYSKLVLDFFAFVAWPAAALWVYSIINQLNFD